MNYQVDQEVVIKQKIEELYDDIKKDVDKFKEFFVFLGVGKKSNRFLDARICLQTAVDAINIESVFQLRVLFIMKVISLLPMN